MLSLAAVLVMFLLLGDDYPRLDTEFGSLLTGFGIFLALTSISAASFYALLIGHGWRYWSQVAVWGAIAATGYYFWPS